MADTELTYKISIALTPGITSEVVERMEEYGVGLDEYFNLSMGELSERLGGGPGLRLDKMVREEALFRARREEDFMKRHHIRGLFLTDEEYPPLLRELHNAPVMIFVLGDSNLNPEHALALVGTRRCSGYGAGFVNKFVEEMALYFPELAIVSGLAYGIDAAAHTAALEHNLPTWGVLAHGLDMIYPAQHRDLAKRILDKGGALISEYPSGTTPYRNNFLQRNRIVAGISELTVVVESEIKGGAMSTASQAFNNNRNLMAVPGRVSDPLSAGCNHLIRKNKAQLLTCAADIVEMYGWAPVTLKRAPRQRNLFPELTGIPADIYKTLGSAGSPMTTDAIRQSLNIGIKDLIAALTEMEFDGIISRLPGGRYELG